MLILDHDRIFSNMHGLARADTLASRVRQDGGGQC